MMINRRMSVIVKRIGLLNRIFTSIIVTHYNRGPEMWLYIMLTQINEGVFYFYNFINALEFLSI